MNSLPVIQRELRVQARRPGTHWLRVGIAGVGLMGFAALVFFSEVPDPQRGKQLYLAIALFGFAYALIAGVLLTADAINEERSHGTLGLMFLTDLRARDILLGKLAATSLNGSYVLIGLLPLLAVPLMFGGVTLWQVAGHAGLMVNTLLLSLAVGLWASTVNRETGVAIAKGLAVMAVIVVLPLILAPMDVPLCFHLATASPAFTFALLLGGKAPAWGVGWQVTGLLFPVGLAMVVFVSTTKRLSAEDALADEPPEKFKQVFVPPPRFAAEREGSGAGRIAFQGPLPQASKGAWGPGSPPPAELLESDPILWLLWRRNRFPRADAAMIGVLTVVALPTFFASLAGPLGWYCVAFTAFILHLLAVSHMTSQACQRIRTTEEREALELLLTTPRAARGTLTSYHRGFCQLFTPQFWSLVTVHGMLLLGALLKREEMGGAWLVPAIALGVLFAERSALSWVGLNLSLRHGRYHRALAGTLFRVLLPSWGAVAFALLGGSFLGVARDNWWTAWLPWLATGCILPFLLAAVHRANAGRWLHEHGAMGARDAAA